jgi:hypothetical protein
MRSRMNLDETLRGKGGRRGGVSGRDALAVINMQEFTEIINKRNHQRLIDILIDILIYSEWLRFEEFVFEHQLRRSRCRLISTRNYVCMINILIP